MDFSGIHTQNCFGERVIGDLGSAPFWSAMELQLGFLDASLDQLVEGLDIGKLLDPPSSLVVLNSHSGTKRIDLIVGAVFVQGEVGLDRLRFMMGLSTRVSSVPGSSFDRVWTWLFGGWRSVHEVHC